MKRSTRMCIRMYFKKILFFRCCSTIAYNGFNHLYPTMISRHLSASEDRWGGRWRRRNEVIDELLFYNFTVMVECGNLHFFGLFFSLDWFRMYISIHMCKILRRYCIVHVHIIIDIFCTTFIAVKFECYCYQTVIGSMIDSFFRNQFKRNIICLIICWIMCNEDSIKDLLYFLLLYYSWNWVVKLLSKFHLKYSFNWIIWLAMFKNRRLMDKV